jgi:hypothetical protein
MAIDTKTGQGSVSLSFSIAAGTLVGADASVAQGLTAVPGMLATDQVVSVESNGLPAGTFVSSWTVSGTSINPVVTNITAGGLTPGANVVYLVVVARV